MKSIVLTFETAKTSEVIAEIGKIKAAAAGISLGSTDPAKEAREAAKAASEAVKAQAAERKAIAQAEKAEAQAERARLAAEQAKANNDAKAAAAEERARTKALAAEQAQARAAEAAAIRSIKQQREAGYLGQVAAEREIANIQLTGIRQRLQANQVAQQVPGVGGGEQARLVAEEKRLLEERSTLLANSRKREQQATLQGYEQEAQIIASKYAQGLINQRQYSARMMANEQAMIGVRLGQARQAAAKLGDADVEGKKAAQAQIAKLEAQQARLGNGGGGGFRGGLASAATGAVALSFAFNQVSAAFQGLVAIARPGYDALVGSNERLNQSILKSQANLASSTRIFQGGVEITDPTAKIQASLPQIKAAMKQLETDTLSLVGVTSAEVTELFNITLSNAAAINGQSKQFPDAISAATALTKGWAAGLQVVGVPLFQARQEINSILKGQIDNNSIVAKSLNLTNEQVQRWRAQGVLVDELNKKLSTFVAGNALAANSITGIGSNIKDVFEKVGREGGEPLLAPIIKLLKQVEQYLLANNERISRFVRVFTEAGGRGIEILQAYQPTIQRLEDRFESLGPVVATLFNALVDGVNVSVQAIQFLFGWVDDLINVAAEGYKKIADLINLRQNLDAIAAIEEYGNQIEGLGDQALMTQQKLKALNDAEKAQSGLTTEQITQRKLIIAQAKTQAENNAAVVKSLKEMRIVDADVAKMRDQQIAQAENYAKLLDRVTGGINIQGQSLARLGSSTEQFANKLANAQRNLANQGNGDQKIFTDSAKEIISLAKTGVEAKDITLEAARQQLEAVRDNTALELDVQRSAQSEITNLYQTRIGKIKELLDVGELTIEQSVRELETLSQDEGLKVEVRRKAAQQRIDLQKQAIAAEQSLLQAQATTVQAQKANERIGEMQAERETTALKLQELAKRAEANKLAQGGPAGETQLTQLRAEAQQIEAERLKLLGEAAEKERKAQLEYFAQMREVLASARDLGQIDQQQYNQQLLANDLSANATELQQRKAALGKLAEADQFGRNVILAQIATLESKRIGILRAFDNAELERVRAQAEREITVYTAAAQQSLIADRELAQATAQSRLAQYDQEIAIQRSALARLAVSDRDGRARIEAEIAQAQVKRIQALDAYYQAQLNKLKEYQERASAIASAAETERSVALQRLENRQTEQAEDLADERLASQLEAQAAQLKAAQEYQRGLEALSGQTRSIEQERAYQGQVIAARQATAQATLRQLELEGQAIQLNRQRTINTIDAQSAASNRATDRQLSQIANLRSARNIAVSEQERGSARETNAIERVSNALGKQNDLLTARNNLAKALEDAQQAGLNTEQAKVARAIELTRELQKGGQTDQERITIQRQIADLVGSNTLSVAELTSKQQQLEQRGANLKAQALVREQDAARQALAIEQQRNDLAAKRAVIEAKIAKIKADSAVIEARQAADEQRLTDAKAIQSAQSALAKAQAQAPSAQRTREVADAQTQLEVARQAADRNRANSAEQLSLAQQQAGFAAEGVTAAQQAYNQQAIINQLQQQTLVVQQQTAISTTNAANEAARYANELERARNALGGGLPVGPTIPNLAPISPLAPTQASPADRGILLYEEIRGLRQDIQSRPVQQRVEATFPVDANQQQMEQWQRLQRATVAASI